MLEKMLLEKAFCTAVWPGTQQLPGHISKMHYTLIYTQKQNTQNIIVNQKTISVSETRLDENVADSEFTPDGYSCFRKDRS